MIRAVLVCLMVGLVAIIIGSKAAVAQCSETVGGGFGGVGIVGEAEQACEPSESPNGGPATFTTRTVRAEPSLCAGTPDALQETIRVYDSATRELLSEIVRCLPPLVPGAPAPPSAESVFREAPLPLPEVHLSPRVRGLVGLETWLWWGADTAVAPLSVSAGEWTATVEARVSSLRWDLGNGDVLTGEGSGSEPAPSATYVYTQRCACTVSLTVVWEGTVTLSHPALPAPIVEAVGPVEVTDSFAYEVEEREAVIIG